jgi:type I restriction enzyme M protein
MSQKEQDKLGKTLWAVADDLRDAMNADSFRDYMLSFLFLRYLSHNYEESAKKELGSDYPKPIVRTEKVFNEETNETEEITVVTSPLSIWYAENLEDIIEFEKQMRRKVHFVIRPEHLWSHISELARTQDNDLLMTLSEGFR